MKTRLPGVRKAEKYDRMETPVVGRDISHAPGHHHKEFIESSCSRYSGWDDDKTWSSQEWKADESMDDRAGQPVVCSRARTHEFHVSLVRRPRTSLLKKKIFTIERGHPLLALNEEQGHSNSSLDTTKQNRICREDPDHSWIG